MDSTTDISGVSRRRSLFIWALCCVLAGIVFLAYAGVSLAGGRGQFLMPLDDVYIHFQYARQLATGEPYVYNPGLPPTSGATSFLYPYLLAAGYLLGFQELSLGVWALGLSALALAGSTWLVYRLSRCYAPYWIAVLLAVLFALSGPVSWHFMSGMETGLMIFLVLLTLHAFVSEYDALCMGAAAGMALMRPEGGALALLAAVALYIRSYAPVPFLHRTSNAERVSLGWLLLPLLAMIVQPIVNFTLTGSMVASGNQSKSVFGMVPAFHDVIIGRIISNFARTWVEFISGFSAREGWYVPFIVTLLSLIGLIFLLRAHSRRLTGLLVIGWLVVGTMAVATLDTAFWHFKRYQMPMMALFFPLAAWGLAAWPLRPPRSRLVLAGLAAALVLLTALPFLSHYLLNVNYVYAQPLQMARWLAANTPSDAVVAVHDTGMMRYGGGRTTIDMVGLTTPGTADAWRNGPGAVGEVLESLRPDYIASYGHGHGFGLGLLADTSLYANELVRFPVSLDPNFNVALAADTQGIYAPDWSTAARAIVPWQPYSLDKIEGFRQVDQLDVADLVSERAHKYTWRIDERVPGFPTEYYEMDYVACPVSPCAVMDGGRLINGEETFEMVTFPGEDLLLVTRVHPRYAGTLDVYVDGLLVDTQWIPELPGSWLEIVTFVSGGQITDEHTKIRIVPHVAGGHYIPYMHWAYQGVREESAPPDQILATFDGSPIVLHDAALSVRRQRQQLAVSLLWGSTSLPEGDYKVFVHLLDEAGNIAAQTDVRPGNGTLPPGNWLSGTIRDTIMVDLTQVSPGSYQVAIGLYDPVTFARLMPSAGDETGRLLIGDVVIDG